MKPKGLFVLPEHSYDVIYGPDERQDIANLAEIFAPRQNTGVLTEDPAALAEAEVIFSGWGAPHMDAAFLAAAPRLKAVFYGAGSIKGLVSDAFWARGIVVSSAYAANAVPVAEFTLSQILFCLKLGWRYIQHLRQGQPYWQRMHVPGAYGSTVGIVSLGMIGRMVCEHLKRFDVKVIAYDPFVKPADAAALGVELCSLGELFRRSDVVSLHTPWLKETEGLITGQLLASMKPDAAFINTARGAVVREDEMIEVLRSRPDLQAVLDVTHPEPPPAGSPLYTLPNVAITPHIAGSMDNECRRMGRYMVQEFERYLKGEPLRWGIGQKQAAVMA